MQTGYSILYSVTSFRRFVCELAFGLDHRCIENELDPNLL